MQYLIDHRELSALHSANVKLCLSVPNFGKNLPSDRMCDIFTHLGDLFPSPAPSSQNEFDVVLNDVSVLISGLMEYYTLSQAVFKGTNTWLFYRHFIPFFRSCSIFNPIWTFISRLSNAIEHCVGSQVPSKSIGYTGNQNELVMVFQWCNV